MFPTKKGPIITGTVPKCQRNSRVEPIIHHFREGFLELPPVTFVPSLPSLPPQAPRAVLPWVAPLAPEQHREQHAPGQHVLGSGAEPFGQQLDDGKSPFVDGYINELSMVMFNSKCEFTRG